MQDSGEGEWRREREIERIEKLIRRKAKGRCTKMKWKIRKGNSWNVEEIVIVSKTYLLIYEEK